MHHWQNASMCHTIYMYSVHINLLSIKFINKRKNPSETLVNIKISDYLLNFE
jgi:hypothetical protein